MTSKELLQIIKKDYNWETADCECDAYFQDYFTQIERDLEILEIIKNKCVYPIALMTLHYELYNKSVIKEQQLTPEEYKKFEEWLKIEGE